MIKTFTATSQDSTKAVGDAAAEANDWLEALDMNLHHIRLMHAATVYAPSSEAGYDGYYTHIITLFVDFV